MKLLSLVALCALVVRVVALDVTLPDRLRLQGPFDRGVDSFSASTNVIQIPFDGAPIKLLSLDSTNDVTVTLATTGYTPSDSARTIVVIVNNTNSSAVSWALSSGTLRWAGPSAMFSTNGVFTFTSTSSGIFGQQFVGGSDWKTNTLVYKDGDGSTATNTIRYIGR